MTCLVAEMLIAEEMVREGVRGKSKTAQFYHPEHLEWAAGKDGPVYCSNFQASDTLL